MRVVYDDGGRKDSGFKGDAGDCLCRSVAIVTGKPYAEVYAAINDVAKQERFRRGKVGLAAAAGRGSSARNGVLIDTARAYLDSLGFKWVPTMRVGTGCTVHLSDGELPVGRLIVRCSRHFTAVIDGVIHDTHDPSRNATRCVYGYWILER